MVAKTEDFTSREEVLAAWWSVRGYEAPGVAAALQKEHHGSAGLPFPQPGSPPPPQTNL